MTKISTHSYQYLQCICWYSYISAIHHVCITSYCTHSNWIYTLKVNFIITSNRRSLLKDNIIAIINFGYKKEYAFNNKPKTYKQESIVPKIYNKIKHTWACTARCLLKFQLSFILMKSILKKQLPVICRETIIIN